MDRRIIYLVFFILVVIAHLITLPTRVTPSTVTKRLYETVESLPLDKAVLVDSDWGAGIKAESEGQMRALLHHAMRRGLKIVILSWTHNLEGQKFGYDVTADVAKDYGYRYGRDWCVLAPLTKASGQELAGLAKDIHGTLNEDTNGVPLDDAERLPMMQHIRTIHDIGLVFQVAYGHEGTAWLGFIQAVYGTNVATAVSAISSSTAYSYVESGQFCGMLAGAPGAAEYEELLGLPKEKRFARKPVSVLSLAIGYILLMIVIGNVAYWGSTWGTKR